ncbi:MAG: UrcA family protein [Pseudomonadota bacterium]
MKTKILAAMLAAFVAPAFASDEAPPEVTAYEFALDLSGADTPDGASRIYADIRRQAARVCSPLEMDGMTSAASRKCRAEVVSNAVRAVDRPMVTALWRQDDAERIAQR